MPSREILEQACPRCGKHGNRVMAIRQRDLDSGPHPGDAVICSECYGVAIFDENLIQRLPTPEEQYRLDRSPIIEIGKRMMADVINPAFPVRPAQVKPDRKRAGSITGPLVLFFYGARLVDEASGVSGIKKLDAVR